MVQSKCYDHVPWCGTQRGRITCSGAEVAASKDLPEDLILEAQELARQEECVHVWCMSSMCLQTR